MGDHTDAWVNSGQLHKEEHTTLEKRGDLEKAASQGSLPLVFLTVPQPAVPPCHGFHLSPSVVWETVMTKLDSSFSLPSPVARSSSSRGSVGMSYQTPVIRSSWSHKAEERQGRYVCLRSVSNQKEVPETLGRKTGSRDHAPPPVADRQTDRLPDSQGYSGEGQRYERSGQVAFLCPRRLLEVPLINRSPFCRSLLLVPCYLLMPKLEMDT